MDFVSLVNLWCQMNGKPLPNYVYYGEGEQKWRCVVIFFGEVSSGTFSSKKLAKQDAAKQLYTKIKTTETVHLNPEQKTVLLIDGDQRSDVVKWLEKSDVTWENLTIRVYVSPNTSLKDTGKLRFKYSKTTNRDSADALLLMELGRRLHVYPEQDVVIVSADHILIQAAQDNDLLWAKDLNSLKSLLKNSLNIPLPD